MGGKSQLIKRGNKEEEERKALWHPQLTWVIMQIHIQISFTGQTVDRPVNSISDNIKILNTVHLALNINEQNQLEKLKLITFPLTCYNK